METCIYKGIVTHRRFKPKRHFFSYKTFSIFFDLDELKNLENNISIFSLNKFNLFSFYNKDHGDRDGSNLKSWVFMKLKILLTNNTPMFFLLKKILKLSHKIVIKDFMFHHLLKWKQLTTSDWLSQKKL